MIHHVTRATRHLIFWSLLLTAISLSGVRLALIGVERYKSDLETRLSGMIGAPVKVGGLGAKMRGVSPELVLKNIAIESALATEKPALSLKEVRLGINLGEFLVNRDILSSSWVTLVGARISIYRKQDGELVVEGLKAGNGQPLWLMQGRHYEVLQSQVIWQDRQNGGKPILLDPVNLAISNEGEHHRINMLTKLPEKYGADLTVAADFEGDVAKPSDIKGSVFVEGRHIQLVELIAGYLPSGIGMINGASDFKIWGQWQQGKPVSLKGELGLRQAVFSRTGKGVFPVNNLETEFNWQMKEQQWQLDINRFLLETADEVKKSNKKWPDALFSIANEKVTETGLGKLKMYVQQLDLGEVSKLIQFFVPLDEKQARWLTEANVTGLVSRFSLYTEPDFKSFAVAGWFDSVSIEPFLNLPGIDNISGQIKGSDKVGKIALAGQDSYLKDAQLFNKPLLLKQLKGLLAWQNSDDEWLLSSQSVDLDCAAFQSSSRFFVRVPKSEEKPFVDLQMALKSDDVTQIAAYLPTQIMGEVLKNWLGSAFIAGKVTNGNLLLYGKLSDYPFNDDSGVFEAKLDLDKLDLNFNPLWPPITGIKGELTFVKNNIRGLFHEGYAGKVNITKTELQVSDLGNHDEFLTIDGEAHGEINQALDFLKQSPLASRITQFTSDVVMQGTTSATLAMTVPLWPGHELKVDGSTRLNDAQLTVNWLDLKVKQLKGDLKFNNRGIYADAIQAVALEHPIQVNIAQAEKETSININGNATVKNVERLFDWPETQVAEGESAYQLQLTIPKQNSDDSHIPTRLSLNSSLEGIELQLPGYLAKTKTQEKPSSLTFSFSDEKALPIELDYNNDLKAAINLDTTQRKITSGNILIGDGKVAEPRVPGVKLEINREQLPLQDWLGLASSQQQAGSSGLDMRQIKIHSKSALWKKTRLGEFDLVLNHNPADWSGEIDSSIGKGKFQLPNNLQGINPIVLDMDMLNISALKQFNSQQLPTNTAVKPLLNIHSKKTLWQSEDLGQLTLETQRTSQGMMIKHLELEGDSQKLVSSGEWKTNGLSSTTVLKGQLKMNRADQFFDKLGITKDLTNTSGVINFNLNWNGSPWQLSVPNLQGDMDVNLESGRLLSVEPGFGRILGILAVAQWFKRLQLDFRDIYAEGLTFDSITGHFNLLNGKATTQDLMIDAVPAKITIAGETDLVNQTVDHVIKVVPKSLDAVPIAGTIVGRVAAMVGKTLTGKDQEGFFFGTQYLVKGSWDDAKIKSLHENDGLFQKTWSSITDFPWVEQK